MHRLPVLYQHATSGVRIFPEGVAWTTSDILGHVLDGGTAVEARKAGYTAPAYGKTGTTNDYLDGWFAGYTDKLTTAVWVGFDQPKTIMERGYGSTLALPVWTAVMKAAETGDFQAAALPAPAGTKNVELCRECGGHKTMKTRHPYQMNLPPAMMPRGRCPGHGGLFAKGEAIPFPVPGESPALVAVPTEGGAPAAGGGDAGLGKAVRGIGRFLFGQRQ